MWEISFLGWVPPLPEALALLGLEVVVLVVQGWVNSQRGSWVSFSVSCLVGVAWGGGLDGLGFGFGLGAIVWSCGCLG